jgi:hypothetical protein
MSSFLSFGSEEDKSATLIVPSVFHGCVFFVNINIHK